MTCTTCRAIAGEVVLTNGPRLEVDEYWRVEHCHPVAIEGWLVLVLRRHARSLHELTELESAALGHWLSVLPKALHAVTGSELEYVMQFAEGDGFHHVHVHLVARAPEWPADWRGPRVFAAFGVDDPVSADRVTSLMEAVGAQIGMATSPIPS